jgi:hypothetical protein
MAVTVVAPSVLPSPKSEGLGVHKLPLESVHVARSNEAAEFALCCGPDLWLPFTDKDFYSSFRLAESPRRNVEYSYAAHSQLPRPDSHRQTLSRTGCTRF